MPKPFDDRLICQRSCNVRNQPDAESSTRVASNRPCLVPHCVDMGRLLDHRDFAVFQEKLDCLELLSRTRSASQGLLLTCGVRYLSMLLEYHGHSVLSFNAAASAISSLSSGCFGSSTDIVSWDRLFEQQKSTASAWGLSVDMLPKYL
jgi:hypothetical protein